MTSGVARARRQRWFGRATVGMLIFAPVFGSLLTVASLSPDHGNSWYSVFVMVVTFGFGYVVALWDYATRTDPSALVAGSLILFSLYAAALYWLLLLLSPMGNWIDHESQPR